MADGFGASQNTATKASEGLNTKVSNDQSNTDGNLYRPTYNSGWTRQTSVDLNNQMNVPSEQTLPAASSKRFGFINNVAKSLIRGNSFDDETKKSPSSLNAIYQPPQQQGPSFHLPQQGPSFQQPQQGPSFQQPQQGPSFQQPQQGPRFQPPQQGPRFQPEQRQVGITEQQMKPCWEDRENPAEGSNQGQSEGNQNEAYRTGQASAYQQNEYYNNEKPSKKKGLSVKIDRMVQRLPGLGKLYRQSSTSSDKYETNQEATYNPSSGLAYSNQFERELSPDELALNERYSNKTRIQIIDLQEKNQTQPVDVSIHHETNKIYLCDIGRSIVEIYDLNGTLQHVINNATMTKFQPTAIAVAAEGTIIISSHFSHCLHMYTPSDPQNEAKRYSYKQFKLGAAGTQIHQFQFPAGIAIDSSDGNLYVCDRGNYRIQVMTPAGVCERVIELFLNSKKKDLLDPVRVAFQQKSKQLVCIVGTGDAICFIPKDSNGPVYVDPFYILDENGLGLEGASGLAVDAHDRIFIADTAHNRIVICTPDGCYITSFGTAGTELGQLKRPCGLDIASDGTVIVTDPGNKRLQLLGSIPKQTPVINNPPKETPDDNKALSVHTEDDLVSTL